MFIGILRELSEGLKLAKGCQQGFLHWYSLQFQGYIGVLTNVMNYNMK